MMMNAIALKTSVAARAPTRRAFAAPRGLGRSMRRSVTIKAESDGPKIDTSSLPVKAGYAAGAWGCSLGFARALRSGYISAGIILLTAGADSPISLLGKAVLTLHILSALTAVARLGAVARSSQQEGEKAAGLEFAKGLALGPLHVGWFGQ